MKQVAPEVKDVTEEEIPGASQRHQKFMLFMSGDPVTERPFDRTGTKLDLSDPQVRSISGKRSRTTASVIEIRDINKHEPLAGCAVKSVW